MKKYVLGLILWSLCFLSFSQEPELLNYKIHPGNKAMSQHQIKFIKENFIILRLHDKAKQIEKYRKSGNIALADEMTRNTKKQNLTLMLGFVNYFLFTKVYFTMAQDIDNLEAGDTIYLVNQFMQPDGFFVLPKNEFYFIEFGERMGSNVTAEYSQPGKYRTLPNSTVVEENALVVKDKFLQQLQPPFPLSTSVPLGNKFEYISRLQNNALIKYYSKVIEKETKNPIDQSLAAWISNDPNKFDKNKWREDIEKQLSDLRKVDKDFIPIR